MSSGKRLCGSCARISSVSPLSTQHHNPLLTPQNPNPIAAPRNSIPQYDFCDRLARAVPAHSRAFADQLSIRLTVYSSRLLLRTIATFAVFVGGAGAAATGG